MKDYSRFTPWIARITSIIIASLLWYYVFNLDRITERIIIPIEFQNKPKDKFADYNFSNEVMLSEVSGKKEFVKNAINNQRHLKFMVDLKNAKSGPHEYKLHLAVDPTINKLLSKIRISPEKDVIHITFQKIIQKMIDVSLNIKATAIPDFMIIKTEFEPKQVLIQGPESILNNIHSITTEFKSLNNLKNDNKGSVQLAKLPNEVKLLNHKNINYKIIVDRGIGEVIITDVVVVQKKENFSSPLVLVEKNLKLEYIKYKGPYRVINKIDSSKLRAYINLIDISKPGTYEVQVTPQEIQDTTVVDFAPKSLKVKLKRIEE